MRTLVDTRLQTRTQTAPDERRASAALRAQVAALGRELDELACSSWPRVETPASVSKPQAGARLLSFAELEQLRDRHAAAAQERRAALAERTLVEEVARRRREEMLLHPERNRGMVVDNAELGEPGCTRFEVRPRLGLLGMLMNWWRVVVSSGCP